MRMKRLLASWIAFSVGAAMLLAPLATNAAALQTSHARSSETQVVDVQAVVDDMPCCPGEDQAKDCAGCPLMALCVLSTSIPLLAEAAALVTRDPRREAFAARHDAWMRGLAGHPPDHPPRSNV
jgi:hypothetical protein